MQLATERLHLRSLARGDAASFHAMMSDPEVMAFWDVPPIADPAITTEIVGRLLAEMTEHQALYWAMERAADGVFIGCCDVSDIDRRHRRAEIGFLVGRPFWGAGYAFEAMQPVLAFAARELGLKRLQARTHVGHARSIRLLERLGFAREGLLRSYIERAGERRDCLLFSRLLP